MTVTARRKKPKVRTVMGKIAAKSGTRRASKIRVVLDILEFMDTGYHMYCCAALNITGYGNTPDEAEKSFGIMYKEHLRYQLENGTFFKDLKEHGWTIGQGVITPPSLLEVVKRKRLIAEVVNTREFTKKKRVFMMPVE